MPNHPVLIVNPASGDRRAEAIGLIPAAHRIGLETVTLHPGDDLAGLARRLVDRGCDHLIIAGGDGSLATIAEVARAHDIAFSCVPVGTRNHFAMDLGLDRHHPLHALDVVTGGTERQIDVGTINGQVFLNNVSFGPYPRAVADPDYRSHRAKSMVDAAVGTLGTRTELAVVISDGHLIEDVEVLLVSNNPYRFTGPPDFGRRPALDTGTLGIIVGDRQSRVRRGPAGLRRRTGETVTVRSGAGEIQVGVDGELRTFRSPVDIVIASSSLRVVVPNDAQPRTSGAEPVEQLDEQAVAYLSGVHRPLTPTGVDPGATLLQRIDRIDEALFQRIAGWQSPGMDRVMPVLSTAASHSKIWIATATIMAILGGERGRRTAEEALVAVSVTSVLANLVAKGLFRRPRPTESVPTARRLPLPASFSMPSGHTASGAAFTRVVGAAYPGLRPPLTALAAAIGFSRVYTGVHHPTDVLAGWLLGRTVGTALHGPATLVRLVRRLRSSTGLRT